MALAMDSGLSQRTQKALRELLPTFAASAPQQQGDHSSTAVDLARGLNEVIHPELLEFFRSTQERNIASDVCGPTAELTRASQLIIPHRRLQHQSHRSMAAISDSAMH